MLVLLMCIAPAASANVTYSNLGSPQSFDNQNGWVIDGGIAGQQLAVAITPGQTVRFTDAVVAMGIIFSNLSASPIDLYLASDAAGLPGAQVSDLMLGVGQDVGPFPPGNPAMFACLGSCPVLHAGKQYWLVAEIPRLSTTSRGPSTWKWRTNPSKLRLIVNAGEA